MITNLPLAVFENRIEIAGYYFLIRLLNTGQWVLDPSQYEKFLHTRQAREFFTPNREDHKKIASIFNKSHFRIIKFITTADIITEGMLMEYTPLETEALK